jgi:hypothetical protein
MPFGKWPTWSRETRLLLLTIAISVGVLLFLARFRFPDEPPPAPAQPLERLAARATFDELARTVERLDRTISPSLVVLQVAPPESREPRTLATLLDGSSPDDEAMSYVPALRVRPTTALALVKPGHAIRGVIGDGGAVPILLARNPITHIALVRVPAPAPDIAWQWRPLNPITVPRYVVSVEASRAGSTLRPVFFGRADRFREPRWPTPLLALGRSSTAAEGSFVFSLDGELVGLAVATAGVTAIVPTDALVAAADRLFEQGSPHVTDFGLSLRPLGPDDAKALNTTSGLIITAVTKGSLADGALRTNDFLQAINGEPAVNPDSALLTLAQTTPGTTVTFIVRRAEEVISVPITVPATDAPPGQGS